jgi:hypothetical protein
MASRPPARGAGVAELRRNPTRLPRPLPRRSCTRTELTGRSRSRALRVRGARRMALRPRRALMVEPVAAGRQRWVHPVAVNDPRSPRRSALGLRRLAPPRFLRLPTGRSPTSYPGTARRQRSPLSGQAAVPPTLSRSMRRRSIPNPSSSRRSAPPRSERRRSGRHRLGLNRLDSDRLGPNPLDPNPLDPDRLGPNPLDPNRLGRNRLDPNRLDPNPLGLN